jgi:hypothetical protein
MPEIYNLQQIVTMRGTKASIITLNASLEEVVWAYATDTNELGIYTNGSWTWIGGGGGDPVFHVEGALIAATDVNGVYICPRAATILAAYVYCRIPGSASSTIVDVNLNGVTIFTTQANRPELAWNDADQVVKSGVPDIVDLVENDVISIDIDQVATGSKDLSVVVALSMGVSGGGGGGGYTEGARVHNGSDFNLTNGVDTLVTFDSEDYDTDGIHDAGDPGKLTCKTAGIYLITANARFLTGGTQCILYIKFNGGNYIAAQALAAVASPLTCRVCVTTIYPLEVNEYVELFAYQNVAGTKLYYMNNYSPIFMMQRIG